jgi:transcriptional regulator with XRE-family HTH domain
MLNKESERFTLDDVLRNLIIKVREDKDITASKLAMLINKKQTWIAQIETGRIKTISRDDILSIFTELLDMNSDEIFDYINNEIEKEKGTKQFKKEDNKKVTIFKAEQVNTDKEKSQFTNICDNILQGFNIFFDNVDSKKDVIDIFERIRSNMHSDLGFVLSVYALHWCSLEQLTYEEKSNIFKEISKIIKTHGNCEQCKSNDKSKENSDCK